MPPRRRRVDTDETEALLESPRTPKKVKSHATPKSQTKKTGHSETNGSVVHVVTEDAGSEDDDDELAMTQMTSVRKSSRASVTPRKFESPSIKKPASVKRTVNDTPSKRSSRKSRGDAAGIAGQDDEDPAANLILKVAGQDNEGDGDHDSDEEHSEIASQIEEEVTVSRNGTGGISLEGGFEAYFEQASRKIKTSDNTLSKMPELPRREYLRIIKEYKIPYKDALQDLYASHVALFPEWSFEMDQNYALCLYGFGSKRALIMDFVKRESEVYGDPYIVINGYHPNIDVRQVCQAITNGLQATGADVAAALAAIDSMPYDRLTLSFHNIDGASFRNEKSINAICQIMAHPKIRTICSIDHINAPLLWSSSRLSQTSLIFHDATTFEPYTLETELQSDILACSKKGRIHGDRGIKWILQTLSRNAQSIFRILLVEQIESGDAVPSTRVYEKASQSFAVSNQNTYQAQLGEFLDHEIVIVEQEGGGQEMLRIPFEKAELTRLLTEIDEEGEVDE